MYQLEDRYYQSGSRKRQLYAVHKKPTLNMKTHRLKINGQKKIYHDNMNQKKTGVAIRLVQK